MYIGIGAEVHRYCRACRTITGTDVIEDGGLRLRPATTALLA
jgi:hypothetical protein